MTSRKSTPDGLAASWTEQERELLSAARQEQMPGYLEARMREALDLPRVRVRVHGDAAAASSPQDSSLQHGRSRSFGQPALRFTQLFGAKLWGVLSILAFGAFAYAFAQRGLHGSVRSMQAGESTSLTPSAAEPDRVVSSASTTQQPTSQAAALPEPRLRLIEPNGSTSAATARVQAVSASAVAKRERIHAAPSGNERASEPTSTRAVAAHSGNARAQDAPAKVAVAQHAAAAQSGNARAQDAPAKAAVAQHAVAAHSGNARAQDAPAKVAVAQHAAAAQSGNARAQDAQVGAVAANALGLSAPLSGSDRAASRNVDELRLEAELLDGARRALARGALQQAQQLLERYATRFERGALLPESDVLGIELEMRSGLQRTAQAHASRFVSQYPNHPLCERVRELTATPRAKAAE